MDVRLLGQVELWSDGAEVKLPSKKLRQLLAALAWTPGALVSIDALTRRLWGENGPARELTSLYANISRLRSRLAVCGDPRVELKHADAGYRLVIPAEFVDVVRFRRSLTLARAAGRQGRPEDTLRHLASAEGLVRGEPLAGLPGAWARTARAELEELILAATLLRIETSVKSAAGDPRAVLPELRRLAALYEFDESILVLTMTALDQAGRTSAALEAYREFRDTLVERTGLDPGAAAQQLYARLLQTGPPPERRAPSAGVRAAPAPAAPNTLERDVAAFIGRGRELEELSAEIYRQLASDVPPVCAIDGTPGIGKSALAVHLAHRVRHLCPDGALQIHLRAHDPHQGPTTTEAALDILLTMIGENSREIQASPSLDHSLAVWRRHIAGKRIVLLFDDAASAEQIVPLLPNTPGSLALITSRRRLTGIPDVIRCGLGPMQHGDARSLLTRCAGIAPTPGGVLDPVVSACGGFPLALTLIGNTLRAHPLWNLAELAAQLSDADYAPRADAMLAPLYQAFCASYQELPQLEQTLLRRLPLNPGTRIQLRAAASLADAPLGAANLALLNLVEQNLVTEPEHGHYQLHDMIRLCAAHVRDREEQPAELGAAAARLTRHTFAAAYAATGLINPDHRVLLVSGLDLDAADHGIKDPGQAMAWLDAERHWLRSMAEYWNANAAPEQAAALVHLLARYIDRRSLWREFIGLAEQAVTTWRQAGHTAGLACALTDLATAHWRFGSFESALVHGRAALREWESLGNAAGQADALLQLGRVQYYRRCPALAAGYYQRCVDLRRAGQDARLLGAALQHLGPAQFEAGMHAAGIAAAEEALDIARDVHDEGTERNSINSLGIFWIELGEHARAEAYNRSALVLAERLGDMQAIAACALNLAVCQVELGRPDTAVPLLERAIEQFRDLGDKIGEVKVLVAQAKCHLALGRPADARALIDAAATGAEELSDPHELSTVHAVYGELHELAGAVQSAELAYREALGYARKCGNTLMLATLHHRLGDHYETHGSLREAQHHYRRAARHYAGAPSQDAARLRSKLAQAS